MLAQLVLGGARSGKTSFALAEARRTGLERHMIVTAQANDAEMRERIAAHRLERGDDWAVLETALDLVEGVEALADPRRILVVDCLTLWLSNLVFEGKDLFAESTKLGAAVQNLRGPAIFVTNELGLGLVPDTALGRKFRDAQGRLNQTMAKVCDRVTFVAAGLALDLKPGTRQD